MTEIDEATRARYAITGWPAPVGEERCTRITLKGEQCKHRRAPNDTICQQHQSKRK